MKSYKSDITADPSGFVVLADYVPHIVQEIRYYSTYNFIGERIDGYEEPCALLTKEAARALKSVSNEMIVHGYRLKIFDAYRPACAVKHFVLLDMSTGKELDMGSPFDLFSVVSHPDYKGITEQQYENRMMLQRAMVRNGFEPIDCEWWHFTLKDEPYPDTYFEFPVSAEYLRR